MEGYVVTTPFGRRGMTLGLVSAQAAVQARDKGQAVHKWTLFRALCRAKARLGVSERSLAVLDALLSFHPETVLTGENLVVFPSNAQLCLRAHGMAPATLRRHLAALSEAGLILRRDSPNGKRYARRGRDGAIETAFGFDLSPLVVRAEQIEAWAAEIEAAERALKYAREKITLCRRDICKMIALGLGLGQEAQDTAQNAEARNSASEVWLAFQERYRALVGGLERNAELGELDALGAGLTRLAAECLNFLEKRDKQPNMSANESQNERLIQNSKTNDLIDLEFTLQKEKSRPIPQQKQNDLRRVPSFSLSMILSACPDIRDYSREKIANWRDLQAVAAIVRPILGISPSAWDDACEAMGELEAACVVAAILQRGAAISSGGGYLRNLTQKARENSFSPVPMLMALLNSRNREKIFA